MAAEVNSLERNWLEETLYSLSDVGISINSLSWTDAPDQGFDAIVMLVRNENLQRYRVVYAPSLTYSGLSNLRLYDEQTPVLAIGERITERSATSLRDLRIQYVDGLGNTYLEFGDVYIDIRGRRASVRDRERGVALRPASESQLRVAPKNLFSPRRSQVIFALLSWPHLAMARVQDVATVAGVSLGQAHNVLALLDDAGLIYRGSPLRHHQTLDLLEPWAAEYSRGLRRKLVIATFHSDDPTVIDLRPPQEAYLSSESAGGVGIYRPATLTVYLDHYDRKMAFDNRWRNDPERPPNVTVLQQFWRDPENGQKDKHRGAGGPSNAPWPLVYADLLAANDPRLAQVAATWRDQHVQPGKV
ncbi:type IV toxin-antitoxin system AbiEi family antitoxin [Rhodococcus sp. H29-C3]|uniref:type IV toxin-antitoxin system AbiEi family antitoxin n=1 Tax=Rhodococcus sp. H29-C3 TaxID=3046307 RepID=UPI0024BBBB05|nr:type IV toxin-antitoxin system AbiEi family antitoxin [Rhodococcus sp. H29-C3]MDJ0362481.1 type IV toxin-antitoxin system AbiEi family antitoxin [Rhodococcus sp. H29-C3]